MRFAILLSALIISKCIIGGDKLPFHTKTANLIVVASAVFVFLDIYELFYPKNKKG